jgi:hypothetical protein
VKIDLRKLRPLTDSLDLVRGSCVEIAKAVCSEVQRYTNENDIQIENAKFQSVFEVFESVQIFANVPLTYFVLPTNSPWTVLWFDSFLLNGYASLCNNLTERFGFETLHWRSSDKDSKFLRGSSFTHCKSIDGKVARRNVYCCVADSGRWHFETHGEPLEAEDLSAYSDKRKSDRLNEQSMAEFLGRLGAFPWDSDFYAIPQNPVSIIRRVSYPETIITKNRADIFFTAPLGAKSL